MIKDLIVSLVLLAGTVALYGSLSLMEDPRAANFPRVVIIIMGILSMALLIQTLIAKQKAERPILQNDRVNNKKNSTPGKTFPLRALLTCFVLIVIYFAVMETVGFYTSSFLFFVAVTFVLGGKDLTLKKGGMRIAIALIFTAILFVLFNKLLVVQTPKGLLF